MRNRAFSILSMFLSAVGAVIGFSLSSMHRLETFKLLNILGIVYGLVGVLVLSEFVAQSEKWRQFVVEKFSGVFIWSHGFIPLGGALAAVPLFFCFTSDRFPSSLVVLKSFPLFFGLALIPTFFLEDFVFVPKMKTSKDPLIRSRRFGGFLVVAGMIVQLIAAIQDLLRT